jgi:glycosyltransferase involved in cell wall biosynthesis
VWRESDPSAALSRVAARVRPSLCVVQAGEPMPLVEACLGLGLPTLLYVHDVEFDRFGGRLEPRPGLVCIANSHFTSARVKEVLGLELPVVLPLLEPARYAVAGRGRAVLFVNPHPLKGAELALALAESLPRVRFEFVESWELGDALRRRYRARAERAGNVTWRRAARDVRRHYARARLLLAPSRWEESFGRVVSEAQVSGIPALAARRGGLPEAVGPGGVILDSEAEPGEWRAALARLLEDERARDTLSRAARLHAQRPEIQPAVVVERFLEHALVHAETAQ